MTIHILSPDVVSKIAAGEVIERPASVVKELVENAIDAAANHISIETRGGGVEVIRVTDNGCGIPAAEVELAFQSHATSKLKDITDLEEISSLGFRGEALPSIAGVADVEVLTRARSEEAGSRLVFQAGKLVQRENRARPPGATVTVRRLFRSVPARLKFLKSPGTENGHISNLVGQYCLAFPEIRFGLVMDGRLIFQTSGNGSQRDTFMEVYGFEMAGQLLEVNAGTAGNAITGLVSPPSLSRSSRIYISFFVNHRWVYSRLLSRAAENAYQGYLMSGRYPVVVLNVSLPPSEIDVNVHPAKREIRFQNDQSVFNAVERAIRKALAAVGPPEVKTASAAPTSNAVQTELLPEGRYEGVLAQRPDSGEMPVLRVLGQLSSAYILAEDPDGLCLIDQHAAHERVLYEKVLAMRSQQEVEVQGLLEPATIEISASQEQAVQAKLEALGRFGFGLELFGNRTYLIRTVPALLKDIDLRECVEALLESLAGDTAAPAWEEKMMQSVACHGAVKAGQTLTTEEMRELVLQLEKARQPRTCPHGRPTMIHLSSRQLEREFGRSG